MSIIIISRITPRGLINQLTYYYITSHHITGPSCKDVHKGKLRMNIPRVWRYLVGRHRGQYWDLSVSTSMLGLNHWCSRNVCSALLHSRTTLMTGNRDSAICPSSLNRKMIIQGVGQCIRFSTEVKKYDAGTYASNYPLGWVPPGIIFPNYSRVVP